MSHYVEPTPEFSRANPDWQGEPILVDDDPPAYEPGDEKARAVKWAIIEAFLGIEPKHD